MYPTKAFSILFEYDWGGKGPLFKNQQELVNSLLREPYSSYFTNDVDQEAYRKAHIRLKTYISQLFSADTKRNITKEFKDSLLNLLQEKLPDNYKPEEVLAPIVQDLVAINPTRYRSQQPNSATVQEWDTYSTIVEQWINTIILDPDELNNEYKLGQANGVRQGALLIWSMIYPKNTGNDSGG